MKLYARERKTVARMDLDPWPFVSLDGLVNPHQMPEMPFEPFYASNTGLIGSGSSDSGHATAKRRGGKQYIGCLTCRDRKIKCDGRQPTCVNCERSRFYACRGFVNPIPNSKDSSFSNSIGPRKRLADEALDHEAQPNPVRRSPQRDRTTETVQEFQCINSTSQLVRTEELFFHIDPGFLMPEDLCTQESYETLHDLDFASADIEKHGGQSSSVASTNSPAAVASDDYLLKHYRHVVSHIMMPTIDVARNPWLQIYLPMAMEKSPTSSQLALRTALMAVAAIHLAQTDSDKSKDYAEQACDLKERSRALLMQPIAGGLSGKPQLDKCAALAAAMTLISTDVFATNPVDCNIHVNLAKRIVQKSGGNNFWTSTSQASALYQIFRCYDLVATTTQLGSRARFRHDSTANEIDGQDVVTANESETPEENGGGDLTSSSLQSRGDEEEFRYSYHYILDTTFGIGLRTVSLLHLTIRLLAVCESRGKSENWPKDLVQSVDALERQLISTTGNAYAFKPDAASYRQAAPSLSLDILDQASSSTGDILFPKTISDELIENHQWAFHYALIVYYFRAFSSLRPKDSGDGPNPRQLSTAADCQVFIGKILERLENIDSLTRGTRVRPANTLWPAFIAAVEAVDVGHRHRALIWFSRAAKRGIGNIPRAKDLVMETWRRTDRFLWNDEELLVSNNGLGPIDWRSCMAELGSSMMLT